MTDYENQIKLQEIPEPPMVDPGSFSFGKGSNAAISRLRLCALCFCCAVPLFWPWLDVNDLDGKRRGQGSNSA